MKSTQEEMDTSGHLYTRESSDIFEVAEDDIDITEAAVPEDVVEMSGAQLDDPKGVVYFYIHTVTVKSQCTV